MEVSILLWGFVVLIVLFALSVFCMLIYCGLFTPVVVETSKPPIDSCYIAYKDGEPMLTQLGIYYDDPEKVGELNFRCQIKSVQ